jgi:type 1 fimbriae regulatory protein FimB/type 1 fimbriae regulatory protein FimE
MRTCVTASFFTEVGVERLMAAARKNRWGHRDATMVLVAYRPWLPTGRTCDGTK